MKKIWLLLLISVFMLVGLCGCSESGQDVCAIEDQEKKPLQIGLSFDSFVIERWLRDRDMFVSTARELGAEVNVQVANGVVKEQIEQIEYFIQKKMDVIAIIPIDGEPLKEVVGKARKAGIRILCYDRIIPNINADLYVSFDNVKVGSLMGAAMKEALPQGGKIFAIYGSPTDPNVELVKHGFTEALEGSGLEIVYSAYCDNWLAELAFDAVNEGLQKEQDIVGIMCGNDDLASQAVKALAESRLAGKVAVVAQDAELSACQRIVEGTQTMTVYKPVEDEAKAAAALAVALAKGEDIRSDSCMYPVKKTINDGTYEIPYYSIEPVAVTDQNMKDVIIGDGFHTMEDVYLNIKTEE